MIASLWHPKIEAVPTFWVVIYFSCSFFFFFLINLPTHYPLCAFKWHQVSSATLSSTSISSLHHWTKSDAVIFLKRAAEEAVAWIHASSWERCSMDIGLMGFGRRMVLFRALVRFLSVSSTAICVILAKEHNSSAGFGFLICLTEVGVWSVSLVHHKVRFQWGNC